MEWKHGAEPIQQFRLVTVGVLAAFAVFPKPLVVRKWIRMFPGIPDIITWKSDATFLPQLLSDPDILALKHVSRIIRYFWYILTSQHCPSVWFVAFAPPPVQCSNTNLKMRNKKWERLVHPSNVSESYWRALEQGCLIRPYQVHRRSNSTGSSARWRHPRPAFPTWLAWCHGEWGARSDRRSQGVRSGCRRERSIRSSSLSRPKLPLHYIL